MMPGCERVSLHRVDDREHAYPDACNDQAKQDQTKAREQEEMARTLTRRGHLLLLSKRESRARKIALHDTPVSLLLFHSRYLWTVAKKLTNELTSGTDATK